MARLRIGCGRKAAILIRSRAIRPVKTMTRGGAGCLGSVVMPQELVAMRCTVAGLRKGRRRERNIAVETQKIGFAPRYKPEDRRQPGRFIGFKRRQPGQSFASATCLPILPFGVSALVPGSVAAQTGPAGIQIRVSEFFGTEFGDLNSAALLNQLFGPLFPTAGADNGPTIFSTLIGFVNLAILSIAGMLFLYNVTAGLLQSAHEGEILGRRWSSLWAPLRVLFAVALLIPLPGLGGYNVVQAGTAWLVKGATAMASEIWGQGARRILAGGVPIAKSASRADGELFKTVYRNQLCARIANQQFEAAGSQLRVRLEEIQSDSSTEIISTIGERRDGVCGSYSIPDPPGFIKNFDSQTSAAAEGAFRSTHSEMLAILVQRADAILDLQWPGLISNSDAMPDITTEVAAAMEAATARLASGNREILRIAGGANGSNPAREIVETYITGGDCGKTQAGTAECSGEGWIGAGNWYMLIARLNSETTGLLRASVSARESGYVGDELNRLNRVVVLESDSPGWFRRNFGGIDEGKYLHLEEASRIWRTAEAELERATSRLAAYGFPLPGSAASAASGNSSAGLIGQIWNISFAEGVKSMIENLSPSRWGEDPIIGIVNMGNWYLDVAGSLMFGSAAVSVVSESLANTTVFLIAAPLAAIGVTQSFILPLLPFFYWVFAVIGYFLLVAEAVVASSLWALGHFRLDGEGISGEAGRRGWLLLLSVTLTPTLMIVGYFIGIALFRIMTGLIDIGMFYAMSALTSASPLVAIFGLIASGALVVVAYVAVIEQSFSLVSEFPARALAWIGGDASLGDGPVRSRMLGSAGSVASAIGAGASRLRGSIGGASGRN